MPPQRRGGAKSKNPALTLKRIFAYVLKNYKFSCIIVVIGIVVSAATTLVSTLFTKSLIDDYIKPLTEAAIPDFAPLAQALITLAIVLLVGIIAAYGYNRIMVNVTQGTMKRLRIELFDNMETLPIKYFDTHAGLPMLRPFHSSI